MLHAGKRKVMLHPGEFLFAEQGTHIHTILGSCIAITLWHPVLQIGGMCHYLIPNRSLSNESNDKILSQQLFSGQLPEGRYAEDAMQLFRLSAALHRTDLSEYQAKIFGGADVHDANTEEGVGEKNTAKAIQMLTINDINLCTAHVGETGSRRIVFDVESGEVWVKHTSMDGHLVSSQSGKN